MRHANAMMFSQWPITSASLLLVVPLVLGCSSQAVKVPESSEATQSSAAESSEFTDQSQTAIRPQSGSDLVGGTDSADQEATSGAPLSDADLIRETFGAKSGRDVAPVEVAAEVEPASDDQPASDVRRPRSLFRSLGRALQKGVTDATAGSPADSDDPSSATAEPENPE